MLLAKGMSTRLMSTLTRSGAIPVEAVPVTPVAACIVGQVRTLVSTLVYQNIQRHILDSIGSENIDVFAALELQNRTENDPLLLSMIRAMNFRSWVQYTAQVPVGKAPCSRFKVSAASLNLAFGSAECARLVYEEERRRGGMPYTWILRLRTDAVYLRNVPPLKFWPTLTNISNIPVVWAPGKSANRGLSCVSTSFAIMNRGAMTSYFDAYFRAWTGCHFESVPQTHRHREQCLFGSVLERNRVLLPHSSLQSGVAFVSTNLRAILEAQQCHWPSASCLELCRLNSSKLAHTSVGVRACEMLANNENNPFEELFMEEAQSALCCGRPTSINARMKRSKVQIGSTSSSRGEEFTRGHIFNFSTQSDNTIISRMGDMMSSVALCFSGHARTLIFPEIYNNIKFTLITPLGSQVDTFAALHAESAISTAHFRIDTALSALGITQSRQSWYTSETITPKACKARQIQGRRPYHFGGSAQYSRPSNPMSQAWGNLQCAKLVEKEESGSRHGKKYIWLIRARPDVVYGLRLPPVELWKNVVVDENSAVIWAPNGVSGEKAFSIEEPPCVSDMFAIMDRKAMDNYYYGVFSAWQGCNLPKQLRLHGSAGCLLSSILSRSGAHVKIFDNSSYAIARPHAIRNFIGCKAGKRWECEGRCHGPKGLVSTNMDDDDLVRMCTIFSNLKKSNAEKRHMTIF